MFHLLIGDIRTNQEHKIDKNITNITMGFMNGKGTGLSYQKYFHVSFFKTSQIPTSWLFMPSELKFYLYFICKLDLYCKIHPSITLENNVHTLSNLSRLHAKKKHIYNILTLSLSCSFFSALSAALTASRSAAHIQYKMTYFAIKANQHSKVCMDSSLCHKISFFKKYIIYEHFVDTKILNGI